MRVMIIVQSVLYPSSSFFVVVAVAPMSYRVLTRMISANTRVVAAIAEESSSLPPSVAVLVGSITELSSSVEVVLFPPLPLVPASISIRFAWYQSRDATKNCIVASVTETPVVQPPPRPLPLVAVAPVRPTSPDCVPSPLVALSVAWDRARRMLSRHGSGFNLSRAGLVFGLGSLFSLDSY